MNTSITRFIAFAAGFTGLSAVSSAQTAAQAAAHWEGTVHMEKLELGVVVDLAKNPSGAWIGSLSFPGTPTVDAPLSDIAVDDKSVRFTARVPSIAAFQGSLSADASSLSGSASNADGETTFQLKRTGEASVKLPPPSSPLPREFAGSWAGTIESEGKTKHVGLTLAPTADGIAAATLIAIDHGNLEIPVTTVTIQDRQLRFESRAISGTFHGTLGDSGEIAGEWSEGAKRIPLIFKQTPSAAAMP